MFELLKKDILRTYNLAQGNKIKKIMNCIWSPGVQAVIVLRFGQWSSQKNIFLKVLLLPLYFFLSHLIRTGWGIQIGRKIEVGEGFYIGHFGSIIINNIKVGKNFSVAQNVTIGLSGQGEKRGCPTIGDNVYVAPSAKIFGKIKIGNNVRIGANAVIHKDIPDNTTVALSPGFTIIS